MRALTDQGKRNHGRGAEQSQTYDHVDADVYDFATLRHELGVSDEQEEDDGLGDQLIEEGDDNNNMTFGDAPVGKLVRRVKEDYYANTSTGKDFDFSGNTQRFSTGISEEEAFFIKRKQHEEQQQQGIYIYIYIYCV